MLRLSKLTVRDEIDNGLAYYRYTFLREVPRLYEGLARGLARTFGSDIRRAAVPAHGLVDRRRPRRQSVRRPPRRSTTRSARRRRSRSSTTSTPCTSWAPSSRCPRAWSSRRPSSWRSPTDAHDGNPHRQDEPYRQAHHRHLRAAGRDVGGADRPRAGARAARDAAGVRDARGSARRPRDDPTLARHARRGDSSRSRRLTPLIARRRDVRLPSRVARPAPERRRARGGRRASCCARAGVASDYAALRGRRARRAARVRARSPRPLRSPHLATASARARELAILARRRPTCIAGSVPRRCRTT